MNMSHSSMSMFLDSSCSFVYNPNNREIDEEKEIGLSSSTSLDLFTFKNNTFASMMIRDEQHYPITNEGNHSYRYKFNFNSY